MAYGEVSQAITIEIVDADGSPLVNAPVSITIPERKVEGTMLSLYSDGSDPQEFIPEARTNTLGQVTYYYVMPPAL